MDELLSKLVALAAVVSSLGKYQIAQVLNVTWTDSWELVVDHCEYFLPEIPLRQLRQYFDVRVSACNRQTCPERPSSPMHEFPLDPLQQRPSA